jgi:hypothetical protein
MAAAVALLTPEVLAARRLRSAVLLSLPLQAPTDKTAVAVAAVQVVAAAMALAQMVVRRQAGSAQVVAVAPTMVRAQRLAVRARPPVVVAAARLPTQRIRAAKVEMERLSFSGNFFTHCLKFRSGFCRPLQLFA